MRRKLIVAVASPIVFFAFVELCLTIFSWSYFRADELEPCAGECRYRLLALGDSFTYGQYVERDESYPSQAQRLLKDVHGVDWEVINRGKPGHSPMMIYRDLAATLEETDPDLIVLMAGFNINDGDIVELNRLTGERTGQLSRAVVSIKLFLSRFRTYRVLRYLVLRGAAAVPRFSRRYAPGGMDLFTFERYQEVNFWALSRLVESIQARGIPLILMSYPQAPLHRNPISEDEYYYVIFAEHLHPPPLSEEDYLFDRADPHETAINGVIRYVSDFYDVPLVDNRAAFTGLAQQERYFLDNDEHPNGRGYRLVAENLLDRLVELGTIARPPQPETAP
jgi:lysophospholipase L1-like esterase